MTTLWRERRGLLALLSLALVASTLVAGCRTAKGAASGIGYPLRDQWGTVVLFGWRGDCYVIAGPPRLHAVRGEKITWRVYNACLPRAGQKETATVTITTLKRVGEALSPTAPPGYFPDKPRTTADGEYPGAKVAAAPDPLDPREKSLAVAQGRFGDLVVKVRPDAQLGLYTYVVVVDGRPDQDQEIDIWH
jgi:predicted small secreted protein